MTLTLVELAIRITDSMDLFEKHEIKNNILFPKLMGV